MSKAQPPASIRTMVRVRDKSLLLQVDWGWKGVSERNSGVQRKLGRGECLAGALAGCLGLRFTLWSWLGMRKRESQEPQLQGNGKEAARGNGGLQREHV